MRVYKPTRPGPRGAQIPYSKWYVEFTDHRDMTRRIAGFPDRAATGEMGRKLDRLVSLRTTGHHLNPEMARWVENLKPGIRKRLAKLGLLDAAQVAIAGPIETLVTRFEDSLKARSRTEKHVKQTTGRVRRALDACNFRSWTDFDGLALEQHLRSLRDKGTSPKTSNDILSALKQFTKWAIAHGFATRDPLATIKPVNAKLKSTRERRALSRHEELPHLIETVAKSAEHRGLSGPLRALVYKIAAETGFRVSEIQSLRVGDLSLDGDRPTVTLQAAKEKSRRGSIQPLLKTTAEEIRPYLRSKHPAAAALPLPKSFRDKSTRWFYHDLKLAKIPVQDELGRYADFHALRTAFLSHLMNARENPKVVQALGRHATADMTLAHYTKLGRDDERDALERLHSLPVISECLESNVATGTDDVALSVAERGGPDATSTDLGGQSNRNESATGAIEAKEMVEAAGIEPASRKLRASSVYVRSPRFESRPLGARGRAPVGPAPEKSRQRISVSELLTSPLFSSPQGHGRALRRRLPID